MAVEQKWCRRIMCTICLHASGATQLPGKMEEKIMIQLKWLTMKHWYFTANEEERDKKEGKKV